MAIVRCDLLMLPTSLVVLDLAFAIQRTAQACDEWRQEYHRLIEMVWEECDVRGWQKVEMTHPFGKVMPDETSFGEGGKLMVEPEVIARVCHEANRALQTAQADPTIPVAAPWDECGEEMQASAIDGVKGALSGNTPEQSHDGWVRFKVAHGWTLGPVKDEETKQHPLLVPYDELPDSQRIKDDLFLAICNTLGSAE